MDDWQTTRLTDAELKEFFDRLFPQGFAGADVVQELAPGGWENSPLLACFHPSLEQVFEERLQWHRNTEEMRRLRHKRGPEYSKNESSPEPTREEVRADWKEQPINVSEEVTELVALCLWDVFADNHEVIAADGRAADIGSFRGASAFLGDYLAQPGDGYSYGEEYRFYMGTHLVSRRADLTSVYQMIFRRLRALGANWQYHFPQLYIVDLAPLREQMEKTEETYSPSEAFAKEQQKLGRQEELEKTKAELEEIQNQARRKAMDRPPPPIVRAYQEVYGSDPNGWPPAAA
jgi:hypothetical protein